MSLLSEIDLSSTAENVRKYFMKDYPRLCLIAGSGLKSTTISDMPRIVPVGNAAEDDLVKKVWARRLLNATKEAIESCPLESQIVLISKYLEHNYDWQTQQKINCERTAFYAKLKSACNEFADSFEVEGGKIVDDGSCDLHVYQS